jgi:hypothetical protein
MTTMEFKDSKKKIAKQYRARFYVYGRMADFGTEHKMFWTSEPNVYNSKEEAEVVAKQASEDSNVDYQVYMVERTTNYYFVEDV